MPEITGALFMADGDGVELTVRRKQDLLANGELSTLVLTLRSGERAQSIRLTTAELLDLAKYLQEHWA